MAKNEAAILDVAEKAARLTAEFGGNGNARRPARRDRGSLSGPDRARLEFWRRFRRVASHGRANRQGYFRFCSSTHGFLFEETLAYRDTLVAHLGLTNVIDLAPKPTALAAEDPENFLWASNPDRCCEIRKVLPLADALEGYDAWITGRKRFQGVRGRACLCSNPKRAASKSIRSPIGRRPR